MQVFTDQGLAHVDVAGLSRIFTDYMINSKHLPSYGIQYINWANKSSSDYFSSSDLVDIMTGNSGREFLFNTRRGVPFRLLLPAPSVNQEIF